MDIVVKPITDLELITSAITHPRVWPRVSDDSSPLPEDFSPTLSETIVYLGAFDADQFHGLFMLHAHNAICWEVHTCLSPSAWGKFSVLFAAACVEWVFEHTACQRLITNVPTGNALALRLAKSVGMQQFGVNPRSFLKCGVALDQIMLGISKE